MIATFHGVALVAWFTTVDPVPWARAQMAFTLMFHIILAPLGVSWAFLTLIANYRGVEHGDRDALTLTQRWSKCMAVTFAVGAVTGTVLSFEFGLLWPRFMTFTAASAPAGTLIAVPAAVVLAATIVLPGFVLLYVLHQRGLLPEESTDAEADRTAHQPAR